MPVGFFVLLFMFLNLERLVMACLIILLQCVWGHSKSTHALKGGEGGSPKAYESVQGEGGVSLKTYVRFSKKILHCFFTIFFYKRVLTSSE